MTTISVNQLEEVDWSICVPSKDCDTTKDTLDELLNILEAANKFGMVDLHTKVQRHIMHGEGFIYERNALIRDTKYRQLDERNIVGELL